MTAPADVVGSLEELLWMMPPPGRKMYAPQLADAGVRVHPELAIKKVNRIGPAVEGNWAARRVDKIEGRGRDKLSEQDVEEVGALALALIVLPPPLPSVVAQEFFDLGARVHPDLAVVDAPATQGKMVAILRQIEQRVPAMVGLTDKILDAQAAAQSGDTSKLRALAEQMAPQIQEQSAAAHQLADDIDPDEWADDDVEGDAS